MELTKRQNEIINASIDLIATNGIQNFTMKALSKKIGISEPAIYRHFDNKLAILLTILNTLDDDSQNFEIKNTIAKNGTLDDVNKMLQFQMECFVKKPSLASILFSEEIFQNDLQLSKKVVSIMNNRSLLIETVIVREQEKKVVRSDIDAKVLTNIIMGTVRLVVNKWKLAGSTTDLCATYLSHWKSLRLLLTLQ
jgi:AcrR family transcriptional regulator